MAKTLSAELVVSAVDETGGVLSGVAKKLEAVTAAAKSLAGAMASGIGGLNESVTRLQSLAHTVAPLAAAQAGMEAGRGLSGLVHETVRATAAGMHEAFRMEVAGMNPDEIADATKLAGQMSEKYKSLSQTDIMHAARNMRSVVGTYEEAANLLDPILKLRVAAMGAHPEHVEELAEEFDQLVKGMEIKGVTMDPAKFTEYMQGMAKAINVFGDTLKPTDFYEMFKYGRAATLGLDEKFMLETAPTLAQEMKGSSAGRAMSAFYTAIVGGHLTQKAAEALNDLGLVDPDKLITTKTGSIKGVQPGGVKDSELATRDPYAWVNQVLLPAAKAHGIEGDEKIGEMLANVFTNQIAGQMARIFATQQPRIEKDWSLVEHAQGLEAADTFKNDPLMAWKGVTSQFTNLLQVAGGPLGAPAAHVMNMLADAIAALGNAAKDHPYLAGGGLLTAGGALAAGGLASMVYGLRGIGSMIGAGAKGAGGAATEDVILGEAWAARVGASGAAAAAGGGWLASALLPAAVLAAGAYAIHEENAPYAGTTLEERARIKRGGRSINDVYRDQFNSEREGLGLPKLGATPVEAVVKPDQVNAKVEGNATLTVNVTTEPSPDFWTKIKTTIQNEINAFRNTGGQPATGTAGSTGKSMPESSANPQ